MDGQRVEVICESCALGTAGKSIKSNTTTVIDTHRISEDIGNLCTNGHQAYGVNIARPIHAHRYRNVARKLLLKKDTSRATQATLAQNFELGEQSCFGIKQINL